jgi:hypothetical protein
MKNNKNYPNQFSAGLIHINNNNHILLDSYRPNYDSDEESYVDDSTVDIYSYEDDICDDLENLILDQLEMEQN